MGKKLHRANLSDDDKVTAADIQKAKDDFLAALKEAREAAPADADGKRAELSEDQFTELATKYFDNAAEVAKLKEEHKAELEALEVKHRAALSAVQKYGVPDGYDDLDADDLYTLESIVRANLADDWDADETLDYNRAILDQRMKEVVLKGKASAKPGPAVNKSKSAKLSAPESEDPVPESIGDFDYYNWGDTPAAKE